MRLICIDDETDILNFGDGVKELTWGKEYQINSHYDSTNGKRYYGILYQRLNGSIKSPPIPHRKIFRPRRH